MKLLNKFLIFKCVFLFFVENDVRQIVSSIQSASLNDGEIQKLIEILLNRQSGTEQSATIESWNKVKTRLLLKIDGYSFLFVLYICALFFSN